MLQGEGVCASQRTIPANDDETSSANTEKPSGSLLAPFHRSEPLATGRTQQGSACVAFGLQFGNRGHSARNSSTEFTEPSVDEPIKSALNTENLHAAAGRDLGDSAQGGVHAGGVSPRCQDCDGIHPAIIAIGR